MDISACRAHAWLMGLSYSAVLLKSSRLEERQNMMTCYFLLEALYDEGGRRES